MNVEAGTKAIYKDEPVVVLEVSKGWITILWDEDETKKVRAKDLSPMDSPPQEDGEETKRTMKEQLREARKKYKITKTYAGERSASCGDFVAATLAGLEPIECASLADAVLGEEQGHHQARYQHLNAGQQRMNCGNRMRAALKKGTVTEEQVNEAYTSLGLAARGQEDDS